jgi:hypothetical protein
MIFNLTGQRHLVISCKNGLHCRNCFTGISFAATRRLGGALTARRSGGVVRSTFSMLISMFRDGFPE